MGKRGMDLLLEVKSVVAVLALARIEVVDDVVALGFEQVVEAVFKEEVLQLLAVDEALVLPVEPTEGREGLEMIQAGDLLPLRFNSEFVFRDGDQISGEARAHHGRHLFVVVLPMRAVGMSVRAEVRPVLAVAGVRSLLLMLVSLSA